MLGVEHNVSWHDALDRSLRWLGAHDGMWPSVGFRVLAISEGDQLPPALRTLACHFQSSPTPQATRSKLRLQSPLVIEGVLSSSEFRTLLHRWLEGQRGQIDQWLIPAPDGLQGFWWQMDVPVSTGHFPLIEPLPEFQTIYREARLSGSGEQLDPIVRSQIQDRLFDLDATRAMPALFSRDYLGVPWGMDATYVLIHFPLAVGMNARYEPASRRLEIDSHFRPPIGPADLEVRIGSGLYDASSSPIELQRDGTDQNGWDLARADKVIRPGGSTKVWLSRRGMEADFGWELTVDLGRAPTPELRRERFIPDWYRLGRHEFSREVDSRQPGGGQGDRPSDAFELAIANACGAIGYGVVFAGHLLQSAGVDLVAFDAATRRAYAISATTSNDIEAKLRTWLSVEDHLTQALTPEWSIRPVIITSQHGNTLLGEDLRACYLREVLVLAAEQLSCLKETPPDFQLFGEILAQDPPDVRTPSSPFTPWEMR